MIAINPQLTIRGILELPDVLDHPDPALPITHIVSLWDPPARASEQAEMDHYLALFARQLPKAPILRLQFEDIGAPVAGLIAPGHDHLATILRFADHAIASHGEQTHILMHCWMGISRSTACALSILAQANPHAPAQDLFTHLLALRPWACPNQRLLAFADELLQREDSLLEVAFRHQQADQGDA